MAASLERLLRHREGCKYVVYLDSLKRPTVGIGHLVRTVDKLKLGDKVDDKRVKDFFRKDSSSALSAARTQATRASIKDPNFIVYLASVNFQLGTGWYKKFPKTWKLIQEGKYLAAAQEVKRSTWNRQTPKRVKDFELALLSLDDRSGESASP